MDIGTAKPSRIERAEIRHHLIDIVEPNETISLATFQELAHDAILGVRSRGHLPLIVGGTGLYTRAITAGWFPPRIPPNEALRDVLVRLSQDREAGWLHAKLAAVDPQGADAIDPRNQRRTIRALEVVLLSGRRFSSQRTHGDARYRISTVGIRRPRPELYSRIDARIEQMWLGGLLSETQRLLEQGFSADLPAMSAIGYSQCVRVIRGEWSEEQAKADMRRATRAFVRRQSNWFRETDLGIDWLDADDPALLDKIQDLVDRRRDDRTPLA
jgi:tRNA dimethylallyltransferase